LAGIGTSGWRSAAGSGSGGRSSRRAGPCPGSPCIRSGCGAPLSSAALFLALSVRPAVEARGRSWILVAAAEVERSGGLLLRRGGASPSSCSWGVSPAFRGGWRWMFLAGHASFLFAINAVVALLVASMLSPFPRPAMVVRERKGAAPLLLVPGFGVGSVCCCRSRAFQTAASWRCCYPWPVRPGSCSVMS
jgi:hypothetical protein